MTHPSLAVLVLVSCAISNTPWSPFTGVRATWVGFPESQFADRMKLFKHVLRNDDRWSLVLNQEVKLSELNLPQYHVPKPYKDSLKEFQLVAEGVNEVTAVDVIKDLMDKTPWSGTNVNCTAKVLSSAVTCFTYSNVSYLLSLINRISDLTEILMKPVENNDGTKDNSNDSKDEKDSYNYDVENALKDVRMTFVVLMDKVAAVDGELVLLASGLLDFDGGMSSDDNSEDFNEELVQLFMLNAMKKEMDEKMEQYCKRTPDKVIHQYLVDHGSLKTTSSTDQLAPDALLKHELAEFQKVVDSMIDVYDGLDVETMPIETWIRIIDYKEPIKKNIKFYMDNEEKILRRKTESLSERLKNAISKANQKEESTTDKEGKKPAGPVKPQKNNNNRSRRNGKRTQPNKSWRKTGSKK